MEDFRIPCVWGFRGDSDRFSVGVEWVGELKSSPNGSPDYLP